MKILFILILLLVFDNVQSQIRKVPSENTNSLVYTDPNQKYLNALSLPAGSPWNIAFVYWCFNYYTGGNPLPQTNNGLEMWSALPAGNKLSAGEVQKNPSLLIPGNIFFIIEAANNVRAGIVESIGNGQFISIEADTYMGLTRVKYSEKVIRKTRNLSDINLGFSNFTAASRQAAN